jgi:hypothetical protein
MTAWIPNVLPDEPVESAWGNSIRDRTITPFPNAAARTTAIPTPAVGMATVLLDTGALEIYTDKTSPASWRRPWGNAWGFVYSTASLISGQVTAVGSVYLAAGDFTLPTIGRRYAVNVALTAILGPGDCNTRVESPSGGIASYNARANISGTAIRSNLAISYVAVPTNAAQLSWRTLFGCVSGSGYVESGGITVFDIGPANITAAQRPGDETGPEAEPRAEDDAA